MIIDTSKSNNCTSRFCKKPNEKNKNMYFVYIIYIFNLDLHVVKIPKYCWTHAQITLQFFTFDV